MVLHAFDGLVSCDKSPSHSPWAFGTTTRVGHNNAWMPEILHHLTTPQETNLKTLKMGRLTNVKCWFKQSLIWTTLSTGVHFPTSSLKNDFVHQTCRYWLNLQASSGASSKSKAADERTPFTFEFVECSGATEHLYIVFSIPYIRVWFPHIYIYIFLSFYSLNPSKSELVIWLLIVSTCKKTELPALEPSTARHAFKSKLSWPNIGIEKVQETLPS